MNGTCISLGARASIAVDFWRRRGSEDVVACFLTHLHADHTAGLGDAWSGAPIFCSPDTRDLMRERWPALAARARPLEVGEAAVLQLRCCNGAALRLRVTPLDACHCLGAVMFLFEGDFGRFLHTGDFRCELARQAEFLAHPALAGLPLDRLYLDNTYAFPTRLDACKAVIAAVRAHPEHRVLFGVDSLGKEELLAAVAAAVGEPVCVPPGRLAAVRLLGLPERLFTTSPAATRLCVLPRHQVTVRAVAALNCWRPTLVIVPSAFACASLASPPAAPAAPCAAAPPPAAGCALPDGGFSSAQLDHARRLIIQVPYSLHSSFAELEGFVRALAPRAILPVVTRAAKGESMDVAERLSHLLSAPPGAVAIACELAGTAPAARAAAPGVPLLQRLLGKRAACGASAGAGTLSSWQVIAAAAAVVIKRRRVAVTQQPP